MLSSNPPGLDFQEGYSVLSGIAYEGKRLERHANLIRWAIKRFPNPVLSYNQLIATYYQMGKYGDAEAAWNEMVAQIPEERNARNLGLLAEIQAKAGKMDEAIATAKSAYAQSPNDPDALRSLINMLIQGNKADEAVETAREAQKREPNDPAKLSLLVNALIQGGKVDEAVATIRKMVQADNNNVENVFTLGRVLAQAKRSDEAIVVFKEMLARFPNNEEAVRTAHSMLSTIYADMNDFPKAEAELETVFAKNPDDAGVNNDLGYLYADQGRIWKRPRR